jgi:hypothetical protein
MHAQLQLTAVWRVLAAGVASATQDRPQLAPVAFALRCASLCVLALTLSDAPAVAQTWESPVNMTGFAGVAVASGPHPANGVAVGLKPQPGPVSLEFEYSRSRRDQVAGVLAIETLACNILVQPSRQRSRFQFYGTFGVGLYAPLHDPSRRRGGVHQSSEPDSARNIGGGAKVTLAGPLKLRMDYRAFFLAGGESNQHRFYVGIVTGF